MAPERISHECEFTEHTTHEYKFYHTDILQNQIAFSPKQKKLKVNNELIIDVQENEVKIALLEDKKLASYHSENKESENKYAVANIYLGKVKKLMPGLNAAFIDVGYDKGAFLHYQDLGRGYRSTQRFLRNVLMEGSRAPKVQDVELDPILEKNGDIKDVLAPGQEILVQIEKEPISTKGPRLTAEITIAGRFLVLVPLSDKVFVSQKIKSNAERRRIKEILSKCLPKNFGCIARTMSEGKEEADFKEELQNLVGKWENMVANLNKEELPKLVLKEMDSVTGLLRDTLSPDFDSIVVNDKDVYNEVISYVNQIAPEKKEIVQYYQDDIPLFDFYKVTKQIKSSFGRTVVFKNSAYLVIEQTEALMVIDVNSGNRSKSSNDQETNALEVNLAAADEIARQLRLRDIGGIVVIDFIDMAKGENRVALYDRMRQNMARDKARHNILPLSKFCLMQITRHRVRPVTNIKTEEVCPTCHGTGKSQPTILFEHEIEEKIRYVKEEKKITDFTIFVHPYVYTYLNDGFFFNSLKWKWRRKYCKFNLLKNEDFGMLQYKFFDKNGAEINLNPEKEELPEEESIEESQDNSKNGK